MPVRLYQENVHINQFSVAMLMSDHSLTLIKIYSFPEQESSVKVEPLDDAAVVRECMAYILHEIGMLLCVYVLAYVLFSILYINVLEFLLFDMLSCYTAFSFTCNYLNFYINC